MPQLWFSAASTVIDWTNWRSCQSAVVCVVQSSRWALLCSLCRERVGACIQCSVKACKTSFHVTCAFQFGLDLKTTFDDEGADVQLKVILRHISCYLPSMLWRCWLGGRKGVWPVKTGGMLAWLSVWGRCGFAYGSSDVTATHCLLLQ